MRFRLVFLPLHIYSLFILLICLFPSCLSLSEEDKKIIDIIEHKYGCEVTVSKGVSSSTSSGNKSFLELKCRNFQTDIPAPIIASDIAMICFNEIKSTNKYTHYYTEIEGENYKFSVDTIKLVYEILENNKQIILLLKTERFDFVYERLAPIVKDEITKDNFIAQLKNQIQDKNHRYTNIGFEIVDENYDGEIKKLIRFEGFYQTEKERVLLKLIFSLENDHLLYGIQMTPLKIT